uniref:Uncharacterized protein n=1 Tax=Romanomermis culicivorax TaxID=13658 RepID=A0A915HMZ5_ROMCU
SSPFAEKNYSNISVDDVASGVTVVPNENLTTYYVVRVIFKGNFSLGSSGDLPTLELANDTTSFVEFIGSTTPSGENSFLPLDSFPPLYFLPTDTHHLLDISVAAADGGSNETSNDTSSTLVSRTALAIWNDTLDERLTDAASDVIVRNSSQEPTWTSVVGLTIPESTGDGTNMATDEAFNSSRVRLSNVTLTRRKNEIQITVIGDDARATFLATGYIKNVRPAKNETIKTQ